MFGVRGFILGLGFGVFEVRGSGLLVVCLGYRFSRFEFSRFQVSGSGFHFLGFGFGVSVWRFGVSLSGFRVSPFGVWGSGIGVGGLGFSRFRVSGSGFGGFGVWGSVFSKFGGSGTGFVAQGNKSGFQVSCWLVGFGVSWFRVLGSGFQVSRWHFGVLNLGFGVFEVRGLGLRVVCLG